MLVARAKMREEFAAERCNRLGLVCDPALTGHEVDRPPVKRPDFCSCNGVQLFVRLVAALEHRPPDTSDND